METYNSITKRLLFPTHTIQLYYNKTPQRNKKSGEERYILVY